MGIRGMGWVMGWATGWVMGWGVWGATGTTGDYGETLTSLALALVQLQGSCGGKKTVSALV